MIYIYIYIYRLWWVGLVDYLTVYGR